MKASIESKLEKLVQRHKEITDLLSDPAVMKDQNQFRDLSKEFSQLEPIVEHYKNYLEIKEGLEDAKLMLDDPDMKEMAQEELSNLEERKSSVEHELQVLLLPEDPHENANVFLEIRAGTGGDEAAIFAGDLFRMYSRFAERNGWQLQVWSAHEGDHGGYKEVVAKISGKMVYRELRFESGAHRVQRVPETESQGRVHTSACTVAVLPEPEEVGEINIDPSDLKIDTYRASGAGGQHVNTTDSAVRITHIPTGTVVECQEERSQIKNRAKAMSWLQARILENQIAAQKQETAEQRKSLVGSGDRSQRIRTYNFPQGRITDHRINLTLYKLDQAMDGDLAEIIGQLQNEHQLQLLASVGDE